MASRTSPYLGRLAAVRLAAVRLAVVLLAVVLLAGCGSAALSDSQLRSRASRICALATVRTDRITTPTMPSQEAAFVNRGIAALTPELTALQRLRAPGDMADDYRDAVEATGAEVAVAPALSIFTPHHPKFVQLLS